VMTMFGKHWTRSNSADHESHRQGDPGAHHVLLCAAASTQLRNTLLAVF
jgi:hypothetical protein